MTNADYDMDKTMINQTINTPPIVYNKKEPIVSIATAPGRGAIGVIRISDGAFLPQSEQALSPLLEAVIQTVLKRSKLDVRYAHFGSFFDWEGELLDEGIALYFSSPNSYTGESVLELQGHGGSAVMQRLLDVCLKVGEPFGLRLARAGEFTERAFLNEKIDLLKAESIADLIHAQSSHAAKSAARSLSGQFAQELTRVQEQMIQLRLLVEATLDFPEEEIDFLERAKAREQLDSLISQVNIAMQQSKQGVLLQHGISVVLVGSPNVGKSSLMNALARDEVSIVSPIAGTTRDHLKETIHLHGVPVRLIDTAGLRETNDEIERLGIERTWKEIEKAHLVIHLLDVSRLDDALQQTQENQLLAQIKTKTQLNQNAYVTVYNKIDLLSPIALEALKAQTDTDLSVWVSAQQKMGLDQLENLILKQVGFEQTQETPFMARERHIVALQNSLDALDIAQQLLKEGYHFDLMAEHLRLAHRSSGEILGEFSADDLLGKIFSSFCIGK